MVIRKLIEATEEKILAPWAQKSAAAVREHEEEADDLRTAYQRGQGQNYTQHGF